MAWPSLPLSRRRGFVTPVAGEPQADIVLAGQDQQVA